MADIIGFADSHGKFFIPLIYIQEVFPMVYTTQGTCSRQITFDVVDNKLTNVRFLAAAPAIPREFPSW